MWRLKNQIFSFSLLNEQSSGEIIPIPLQLYVAAFEITENDLVVSGETDHDDMQLPITRCCPATFQS
jgi:hypothetical protein